MNGQVLRQHFLLEGDPVQVFLEVLSYLPDGAVQDLSTLVDQDDVIADLFHLFHPVGAEDDGTALERQPEDLFLDQIGIDGIEAAEWFVQNDEFRFVQHGGHELQLLAHALAEVLNFFVPPALHLKFFEPGTHPFGGFFSRESFQPGQVQRLFADLHFLVQAAFFGHIPDPGDILQRIEGFSVEQDTACIGIEDPRDHAQQGRFAGTVRAQQSEDGSLADAEADVVDGLLVGELFA